MSRIQSLQLIVFNVKLPETLMLMSAAWGTAQFNAVSPSPLPYAYNLM